MRVQSNKVDIFIVLEETCDLVKEVNEGGCSEASWSKCKLVAEWTMKYGI